MDFSLFAVQIQSGLLSDFPMSLSSVFRGAKLVVISVC